VHWQRRWYAVREVHNHWAIHDAWWAEERHCDVYKVQTDTGLLCIILYDRLQAAWYLERIFD